MKKIFINSIIAAISALCLWSCSQEPYDWNKFKNRIEVTEWNVSYDTPNSATIIFICQQNLETKIEEAYIKYNTVDKQLIENFNPNGENTILLNELNNNTSYDFEIIIRTDSNEITILQGSINTPSTDIYTPKATKYILSMPSHGIIAMELNYEVKPEYPLTNAKISINGKNLETTFDNEKVITEINIFDYPTPDTYKEFYITLSNEIGETSWTVPYSANTYDEDTQYSNDGNNEDYIKVCGIDWAKGNLLYEKGEWKIANKQDYTFHFQKNSPLDNEHIEHFCYGQTEAYLYTAYDKNRFKWYTHAILDQEQCDIQGDPAADVVSANIKENWVLPSEEQFQTLIDHASSQYGYTILNGDTVSGCLFYTTNNKKVKSTTYLKFDSNNIDNLGLFLPFVGKYDDEKINAGLYYMSSLAYKGWNYSSVFSCGGDVYNLNNYSGDITISNSSFTERVQYPVRAVKGTISENEYERELSGITSNGAVDLGLSVKWASCNLGASSPEGIGTTGLLKIPQSHTDGAYRTPSKNEVEELINNCTWTWGKYNKVNGYKVEGKNGSSIFIPAHQVTNNVGIYRCYGSSEQTYKYIWGISSKSYKVRNYQEQYYKDSNDTYCIRLVEDNK